MIEAGVSGTTPSTAVTTVAILAGGRGTRLRPAVDDRPKALANVSGRPFIAYLLDQLDTAGFRRVVICSGYRGDQLRTGLGSAHGRLEIQYSHEAEPLGTAGALRLAAPLLDTDPVLVLNGDSFCDVDLRVFFEHHLATSAVATILLVHRADSSRYGSVTIDANGEIVDFVEKGDAIGPGWINAGVYLLGRRLLATLGGEGALSLERQVFPAWVGRGLFGVGLGGRFIDIGTPESYAAAAEFFSMEIPS